MTLTRVRVRLLLSALLFVSAVPAFVKAGDTLAGPRNPRPASRALSTPGSHLIKASSSSFTSTCTPTPSSRSRSMRLRNGLPRS